ncbi:hypothetical protein [Agrococcus lahaulensis]|uniref:hypothetical protein n=1 Tax=Agrococcus lahaulensis TaxID=341722 RepID=UPI00047B71AD|nr:hypothetical protein [Agrococcus lahaulensis]
MAFNALVVQVMISAPGDFPETHRGVIHRAMRRWNVDHGKLRSIIFVPTDWTEGSTPGVADDYAQQMINEQLIDASDVAIVVYTDRLGTPTPEHESGTAEETDEFIQTGKEVLIYRNMTDRRPVSGIEATAEKARLETYLSHVRKRALVGEYNQAHDLELKLMTDLTRIATKFKASLQPVKSDYEAVPSAVELGRRYIEENTALWDATKVEDLTELGIWPRVETKDSSVRKARLTLGPTRTYELVFESNIPYSVTDVEYRFENFDGEEEQSLYVGTGERRIPSLRPKGTFSVPLPLTFDSPDMVECIVTFLDRNGVERETRTTLKLR